MHDGKHVKEYTGEIKKRLEVLADQFNKNKITAEKAAAEVKVLQKNLHAGLKSGRIRLHDEEIVALYDGKVLSIGGGLIGIALPVPHTHSVSKDKHVSSFVDRFSSPKVVQDVEEKVDRVIEETRDKIIERAKSGVHESRDGTQRKGPSMLDGPIIAVDYISNKVKNKVKNATITGIADSIMKIAVNVITGPK